MVPKRCAALFLSSVGVICLLHPAICHNKTGDTSVRELTTPFPELPQRDMGIEEKTVSPQNPCYAFEVGDNEKQEFYSPGYNMANPSALYPNHTECRRVLTAPEGHLIKLDFRDWFELEPSQDCRNDFLEVRDGAHGYNNIIGHLYCGSNFPPMLTSSDRHLWVHFKSDENIEYRGFRAVYEFIPRPTSLLTPELKPCVIPVEGNEGYPRKADISNETIQFNEKYGLSTDCLWVITVKEGWRIQLTFDKFSLARPNECETNFVEVFSDRTDIPAREKIFCGSIADTITSRNNIMFIRFYSEPKTVHKSDFISLYTAFRENTGANSDCAADEFNCEDATCIAMELKCNGRINCRFRWDEDGCDGPVLNNKAMPLSENNIIIIMVIFTLILSGMCFTFLFNCVKKLIRDHRTIQEYIRESREQQLNELGKQEAMEKLKNQPSCSRSNSIQSAESHRFAIANTLTNTSCYVPGGELLPILIRNDHSINGDVYAQNIHQTYDAETSPQPEMCDSACQTRESLFTSNPYNSEHSTPNHSVTSTNSKPSPPAPFSTFGYKKEAKFRAEAKIEMEKVETKPTFDDKRRPYSVQTTKSAPDVIVTH